MFSTDRNPTYCRKWEASTKGAVPLNGPSANEERSQTLDSRADRTVLP